MGSFPSEAPRCDHLLALGAPGSCCAVSARIRYAHQWSGYRGRRAVRCERGGHGHCSDKRHDVQTQVVRARWPCSQDRPSQPARSRAAPGRTASVEAASRRARVRGVSQQTAVSFTNRRTGCRGHGCCRGGATSAVIPVGEQSSTRRLCRMRQTRRSCAGSAAESSSSAAAIASSSYGVGFRSRSGAYRAGEGGRIETSLAGRRSNVRLRDAVAVSGRDLVE